MLPSRSSRRGTELVVLGVLLAVSALFVAAAFTEVPFPILFVLGGLTLGFVPGVPNVVLEPDLVLIIVLPPLLYSAAFFSSLRDLRANVRSISLLSVGLVLATTFGVAAIAHALIDDLSWRAAIVLGAIVSPTDPIAATAIARAVRRAAARGHDRRGREHGQRRDRPDRLPASRSSRSSRARSR